MNLEAWRDIIDHSAPYVWAFGAGCIVGVVLSYLLTAAYVRSIKKTYSIYKNFKLEGAVADRSEPPVFLIPKLHWPKDSGSVCRPNGLKYAQYAPTQLDVTCKNCQNILFQKTKAPPETEGAL